MDNLYDHPCQTFVWFVSNGYYSCYNAKGDLKYHYAKLRISLGFKIPGRCTKLNW